MSDPISSIQYLFVVKTRSPALIEAQKRYYEKTKQQRIQKYLDKYNTDEEFRHKHIQYVRKCQTKKKLECV